LTALGADPSKIVQSHEQPSHKNQGELNECRQRLIWCRRALVKDVLACKQREKEARIKVLDKPAAEGQRVNVEY
jgi:hypothetical protein